jgi:hypothetical protein
VLGSISKKYPALSAFAAFVIVFLCSLPFNDKIARNYLIEPSIKFDHSFYMNIAKRGYESASETAFYPLWPILMGLVQGFFPEHWDVYVGNALSLGMFAFSLWFIWSLAQRLSGDEGAWWTVFLFALNPNSIFHALGYPESFFCLVATAFLLLSLNILREESRISAMGVFATAAMMSASRPILLQFLLAAIFAIALVWLLFPNDEKRPEALRKMSRWFALSAAGMLAGYLPYGIHCQGKFQNFFAPFDAQKYWDRKFGFYWSLITNPKSVSSSDNILTWDIQAFYLPTLLLGLLIYSCLKNRGRPTNQTPTPDSQQARALIVTLCLLIAAAHSAIAFLTYPIFMSLGRHVFATPFFYLGGVAVIFATLPTRPRIFLLRFYLFGSVVYLLNFWTRFGNSAWMG